MKIKKTTVNVFLINTLFVFSIVFKALGYDFLILLSTIFFTIILVLFDKRFFNIVFVDSGISLFFLFMITSTILGLFYNTSHIEGIIKDSVLFCITTMGCYIGKYFKIENVIDFEKKILILGVVFGILEVVLKYNPLLPFFYVDTISVGNRICSIYVHPVIAATFFAVSFWVLLYSDINKYMKYSLLLLDLFALYKTSSRSSWIAMSVTMLLYLIKKYSGRFHKNNIFYGIFLGVSVVTLFSTEVGKSIVESIIIRFENIEGSISQLQRVGGWKYMLSSFVNESNILQLLLGHGYKASFDKMLEKTIIIPGFFTTDNTYIANMYNYGIVNISIILSFLFKVVQSFFKEKENDICLISMSILTISIACVFFECNLFLNISFILYFYCGVFYGIVQKKSNY